MRLSEATTDFLAKYGGYPEAVGCAPGRVEILGNHTDYNHGYIISAAIDRFTTVLARTTKWGEVRVYSSNMREHEGEKTKPVDAKIDDNGRLQKPEKAEDQWACYVFGVVDELNKALKDKGLDLIGGLECYVDSLVGPTKKFKFQIQKSNLLTV